MEIMKQQSYKAFLVLALFGLLSCNEKPIPKPKAYPRIDLPKPSYQRTELPECNYSFDLADFAILRPDPYPTAEECWYNVHYPKFKATLHLSYRPIKNRDDLFKVINDSREMVYKHVMRADEIIENYINANELHGIYYELGGSTATNAQFFVTDSTHHFLRGSLYFNERTEADSVEPVLNFLKKDMLHIIETVKWNRQAAK